MYRIKAKPGYNIIIKDLNLSLRAESNQWIEIDEKKFDKSSDAKLVKNFIIIENKEGIAAETTTKVAEAKENIVEQVTKDIFVRKGEEEESPKDIFVATPATSPEATTTAPLKVKENAKVVEDVEDVEDVEVKEVKAVEETAEKQKTTAKKAAKSKTTKKSK